MKSDYLKYWRVIRNYTKVKYKLSQSDLDMLLFLYSESYFGRQKFAEFNAVLGWEKDRFDRLLRENWVELFRDKPTKHKCIYQLSFKAKRVIGNIYKLLNGEMLMSEISVTNRMFLKSAGYTDKVHRNFITQLNKELRQERVKKT
jgi:hypothetical protein